MSVLQCECSEQQAVATQLSDSLADRKESIKGLEERVLDLMAEVADADENHERRSVHCREIAVHANLPDFAIASITN